MNKGHFLIRYIDSSGKEKSSSNIVVLDTEEKEDVAEQVLNELRKPLATFPKGGKIEITYEE